MISIAPANISSISGPLGVFISDVIGVRPTVIGGTVIGCAGLLLSAFATEVYHLYITYGIIAGKVHVPFTLMTENVAY